MDDTTFIETVKSEMKEIRERRGVRSKGNQFAIWFLTKILREPESKAEGEYHIGGGGDDKIDIGICDDEHQLAVVGQCKFTGKAFKAKPYNKDLVDEVLAAIRRIEKSPGTGSSQRIEFVKRWVATDKPCRRLAIAFGRFSEDAHEYALRNDVEIYDYEKIKQRYHYLESTIAGKEPELIEFMLQKTEESHTDAPQTLLDISSIAKEKGKGFEVYAFFADIKDIYGAVAKYQDDLFQENLRGRLEGKTKGAIGDAIEDTIRLTPERLCILNNGITIMCTEIRVSDRKIQLILPQIVNGCQTSWSIYDVYNDYQKANKLEELDNASIHVKVIRTIEGTLQEETRTATNQQNPISKRDIYSKDRHQTELFLAFQKYNPPILWDYKEGLQGILKRRNELSLYRIVSTRYRRIRNGEAGQLFLALLGKPYLSKNKKGKIFTEKFYRTIFHYDLLEETRFNNEDIGIIPKIVKLKSGNITTFVEDILFAFGISKLAGAYGELYRKKMKRYDPKDESVIYGNLVDCEFLKYWEFYVVSTFNHIINRLAKDDEEVKLLRTALIGTDINNLWDPGLHSFFKLNKYKNKYLLLDERAPSPEYPLFAKWIQSLSLLVLKLMQKEKEEDPQLKARTFIDLRSETYVQLFSIIETILGGPTDDLMRQFPKTLES